MGIPANPTEYLVVTLPSIIVILGVLLNGFSAIVLLRKRFRRIPMGVYLLAMAILDSMFLMSNTLLAWGIEISFGVRIQALSDGGCKFVKYIIVASRAMSAWVLVVMCGERMLAMAIPHLSASINTKKRAIMSTLVVVVLQGLIYSYNFHVTGLNEWGYCYITEAIRTKNHHLVINIFDFINYCVIPSIVMATCNSVLLRLVCHSQQLREGTGKDIRTLAMIVILTSFAFIALTIPMTIIQILYVAGIKIGETWVYPLTYSLDLLNHSINFILYCVSGSSFRAEIRSMFKPCRIKRSKSIGGTNSSSLPMTSTWRKIGDGSYSNQVSVDEESAQTEVSIVPEGVMLDIEGSVQKEAPVIQNGGMSGKEGSVQKDVPVSQNGGMSGIEGRGHP